MNQLMLKDKDGIDVLLLVLEPGNIYKLIDENKPIELRVEDNYPEGIPRKLKLGIFFSPTPVADARKFSQMTKITLDERTPQNEKRRPHCGECRSTIEQLGIWRNESPLAITFCPMCGCVFGMVPQEVAKELKP